jgi:hypothetical protein
MVLSFLLVKGMKLYLWKIALVKLSMFVIHYLFILRLESDFAIKYLLPKS